VANNANTRASIKVRESRTYVLLIVAVLVALLIVEYKHIFLILSGIVGLRVIKSLIVITRRTRRVESPLYDVDDERRGRRQRAPFTVSVLLAVAVIPLITVTHKSVAIILSAIVLGIVMVSFLRFMFNMIKDVRERTTAYVVLFILTNVTSMIGLFANMYRWTGLTDSAVSAEKHSFWRALYFSIVTWTTLGYGDIVPRENSRIIAAIEALSGYVVMALLIVVFQAMAQSNREEARSGPKNSRE
jgi:Ion channel